ncbi:MAG: phasin family protein [Phormidesmis sp.]
MAGFGNLVQKAFYLGVGIASYAGEKAGGAFGDLKNQAQKIVDELVERGELTTEEAQKMMNDMVERAEAAGAEVNPSGTADDTDGPRQIQILDDSESMTAEERQAEALRQEVATLREELQKLR